MSDEFDTEISSCPEGWEVKKLGDILRVKRGKRLVRRELSTRGLYPVYQNSLAPLGFFESYNCDDQSAFIIAAGNAGDVGYSNTAFWAADDCFYFTDCKDLHQKFLYYTLLHNQFYIYSQTRRTSIPRLSQDVIANMLIPLPPLHEQQAIADTLSVFDTHITNLAELIAKKKAIRDGALEDLMSGRTRLKGFSGEWTVKKLGECGKFISGNAFPLQYQGKTKGAYPFYKVSDLSNEGNENYMFQANNYVSDEVARKLSCNIIPATSIVFAKIGAAILLERKRITTCLCCIDNNMMSFQPFLNISSQFICYVMRKLKFGDYVQTTALPSLSVKILCDIAISLPPLDEQQAIADTLTALDDEINALEAERSKIIQIRDGAMNDLLTGKVRLVHH